ncbi:MAG: hypothetical protein WA885_14125 [Phormidesmis sp.]
MSNFKSSNTKSESNSLESLVRIAMTNRELAPGIAAQVNHYRTGRLSCEERRMLAILDDAIADGCVVPVGVMTPQIHRQAAYSVH